MKAIKHLLWMLIALGLSISFASCGGDDNDGTQDLPTPAPGPGEGASELVGKWETVESGQTIGWGYQLKANGTGIGFEANQNTGNLNGTWDIKWVYNHPILRIYEGKYTTIFKVSYVSETSMVCIWCDDSGQPTDRISTLRKVSKFFWE
jgi:uncharacterized lipoprotein YehR (DUF1307 family)